MRGHLHRPGDHGCRVCCWSKKQRRALGRAVSRLICIDPAYLHPCDIVPLPTLILGGGRPITLSVDPILIVAVVVLAVCLGCIIWQLHQIEKELHSIKESTAQLSDDEYQGK